MRQIKFRVWHKTQQRWLDPWAEEDPMMDLNGEVYLYERTLGVGWSNRHSMPKDIVINQWTGLVDKDGNDIYEGDVEKDPLDKGVNVFKDIITADDFAYSMKNKGYTCYIYQGIHYKDVV